MKITSNKNKRHYTINKDGVKYRTEKMTKEEFLAAEYYDLIDWKNYLKVSQSYKKIN